jgi:hypothetical protein
MTNAMLATLRSLELTLGPSYALLSDSGLFGNAENVS